MFCQPVVATGLCTIIESDVSCVLSILLHDATATVMVPCLYYACMNGTDFFAALRIARSSCVRHVMTRVQFSGFSTKLNRRVYTALIRSCMVTRHMIWTLDDAMYRVLTWSLIYMRASSYERIRGSQHPSTSYCDPVTNCSVSFSTGCGVQYIDYATLSDFIRSGQNTSMMQNTTRYVYVDHMIKYDEDHVLPDILSNQICIRVLLSLISAKIPVKELRAIAKMHEFPDVDISYMNKAALVELYSTHSCFRCESAYTVFKVCPVLGKATKHPKGHNVSTTKQSADTGYKENVPFPPVPLVDDLAHSIITNFSNAMSPNQFEESGCCVCGQLFPFKQLSKVRHMKRYLSVLENPDSTRAE